MKKIYILFILLLILSSCDVKKIDNLGILKISNQINDSLSFIEKNISLSSTFIQNDGTFIYQLDTIFTIGVCQ